MSMWAVATVAVAAFGVGVVAALTVAAWRDWLRPSVRHEWERRLTGREPLHRHQRTTRRADERR